MSKYEMTVSLSDIHIPDHSPTALSLAIDFIKAEKPSQVIFNGDIVEMYDISRWPHLNPGFDILTEIEMAKDLVFAPIRRAVPKAKLHYVFANHEHRLLMYLISHAEKLSSLPALKLQNLLELRKFDIPPSRVYYNNSAENYMQYGPILIGHWNRAYKWAGTTVRSLMIQYGMSVVQAHTHRVADVVMRQGPNRWIGGVEQGCLCNLNPSWQLMPDWCNAFTVIHKKKNGDRYSVVVNKIIDDKFVFGGEAWEVKG